MKVKNIILITSIIHTPNIRLSYWHTRSIYDSSTRFEQTKKTIQSVKEKMKDEYLIILVECSPLTEEESAYLNANVDIVLNLYDHEDQEIRMNIYSLSKSLGEGTMTMEAFKFLQNIEYENLFKVTGRYWLSDRFNYDNFNDEKSTIRFIKDDTTCGCTSLYKLNYKHSILWDKWLQNSVDQMLDCRSYENIFADFMRQINPAEYVAIDHIGISGTWAPDGTIINE